MNPHIIRNNLTNLVTCIVGPTSYATKQKVYSFRSYFEQISWKSSRVTEIIL